MATITIQDLQEIAVKATSDFFNESVPLNQSLAKQASDRGLNSEQLKRAVEATNTLTHLKSIEISQDRTSEFPVADYGQILKIASAPNLTATHEDTLPLDTSDFVEKTASSSEDALAYTFPELSPQEVITHLYKQASANARALEDAKIELEITGMSMLKKIAGLRADQELIEHLSASSLTDNEFVKVATLITGGVVARKDFVSGMFKSAALNEVETFVGLYKQAQSLISEIKHRQDLDDRWIAQKKSLLTKEAGLLGTIGSVVGKGVTKIKSTLTSTKVKSGIVERMATSVGSGATRFVTKPVRVAGNAAVNVTGKIAGLGAKKVNNAMAGTGLGKSVGLAEKPISPRAKNVARAGMVGGVALLDAQMFSPKVDPAKDRSGKVWDALQS